VVGSNEPHAPPLPRVERTFRYPRRSHKLLRPLTRPLAEEAHILFRRIHVDRKSLSVFDRVPVHPTRRACKNASRLPLGP
jgi:hypothetical protein